MTKNILLTAVWLCIGHAVFAQNAPPVPRHKFIVACHRGNHVYYPENTLEADAAAIKADADYIEIDLRTTKDGQLVSMHDGSVDRMTDGKGLIKDLTLAQLQQLQVNVKSKPVEGTYRIPTFKQILELCKDKIYIYIDFKDADPTQTLEMLKQYSMEKQVLVYINKPEQFTGWRKVDPTMPLMVSLPDKVNDVNGLKAFLDEVHPDILDGDYNQYTKDMVDYATSRGVTVWPDAESPLENMKTWDDAVARGLKGIQTDHPAALIEYLKGKGLR